MRLYATPPERNGFARVEAVLNAWDERLAGGVAEEMQGLFPEGAYFSYIWHGLGQVNLALEGVDVERQLGEAWMAYWALSGEASQGVFSAELSPPYGIFCQGWRNYLLVGILLAQDDPNRHDLDLFTERCAEIAAAIERSDTPFLPAYPGQTWPVDTFPAIVSLKVHGVLVDDRYEGLIAQWLEDIEAYRDPATGLLPHKLDARTGAILDGTRATSQTLILRFLAELAPDLATQDYALFREQFVVNRFGLLGVLEYPKGVDGGLGDVDSGPLVTGVSLSATAVMLGTARVVGDEALADRLWQSAETIGLPVGSDNRRYLAAEPFPIGNVFAAWSASSQLWLGDSADSLDSAQANTNVNNSPTWRLPLHLLSTTLLLLIMLLLRRLWSPLHRLQK